MNRSTPLKRTGFRPRAPRREQRDPDRVRAMPAVTPGAFRAPQPVATTPAEPVTKAAPVRSEAYRRAVASLPCASCGIYGYSQHAHDNEGKGLSLKTDDRTGVPLCCARPGEEGCHTKFDQYRLLPGGREAHREAMRTWGAQTRATVHSLGLWPNNLPHWPGESPTPTS